MQTPVMIVFDYGNTLLYEDDADFVRGTQALFPYITENPDQLSAEQISSFADRFFEQIGTVRASGFELHERQFQRMVYESLGIRLSISYAQAEIIQWDAATPGGVMPGAKQMLDAVNRMGIRTGVISNIGWSENALQNRLNRLLPNHKFEFVITSSEYGVRKPSPYLFRLALRKAGLSPRQMWFCGDTPSADIAGAAAAGITPVWYDYHAKREQVYLSRHALPACEHLYIREWAELIRLLEQPTA